MISLIPHPPAPIMVPAGPCPNLTAVLDKEHWGKAIVSVWFPPGVVVQTAMITTVTAVISTVNEISLDQMSCGLDVLVPAPTKFVS